MAKQPAGDHPLPRLLFSLLKATMKACRSRPVQETAMTGCMTSHPAETPVPPVFAELLGRIELGSATIGICGLGYVGLPLAKAAFDGSRFHIIGFDIDADKIRQLNAKQSYIRCVASAKIAQMIDTGRFEATDDFNRIAELDAVLICVPTPLSKYREPDLSFVVDTARTISRNARPGQLIILEIHHLSRNDARRPEADFRSAGIVGRHRDIPGILSRARRSRQSPLRHGENSKDCRRGR